MDIIATDLLGLLVVGMLATVLTVVVAIAQRAKHKPRLPDCYGGIWTPKEATALIALKGCFTEMEERIIEDIPLFDETAEPIAPPPPKKYDGPPLWRD